MWAHRLEDALSNDHQARHKVSTTSTAAFSTRLNKRCKRGTTKNACCAKTYGSTAISAVPQRVPWSFSRHPHLQFKNTHTGLKLQQSAIFMVSDWVCPRCVACLWMIFVRWLSLFETCSLMPARALCACARALIPRASGRTGWVMVTRVNLLFPILPLLNWMLIGVRTDKRLKRHQSVTCMHVGPSLLTNAYMQANECTHKLFKDMASKITLNDQL